MDDQPGIIRIFLADDHRLFREALRHLLNAEPDMTCVGEASDGQETLRLLPPLNPGILLLDVAMPGMSGLEVLRQLASSHRRLRTILLTVAVSDDDLIEAVRLGARGVVMKHAATAQLLACIRTVTAGGYWMQRDIFLERLQAALGKQSGSSYHLTPRELQVIHEVLACASNHDIAAKLGISDDTVKSHLSNIYDKLGVSSRLELAMFAHAHPFPVPLDQNLAGSLDALGITPAPATNSHPASKGAGEDSPNRPHRKKRT
jgi:DNA-binding NarL/FixJ family response regulator